MIVLCYCLGTRNNFTLFCQLFTMQDWDWYMPKLVVKLVHVQLTMNCFQLFFIQHFFPWAGVQLLNSSGVNKYSMRLRASEAASFELAWMCFSLGCSTVSIQTRPSLSFGFPIQYLPSSSTINDTRIKARENLTYKNQYSPTHHVLINYCTAGNYQGKIFTDLLKMGSHREDCRHSH